MDDVDSPCLRVGILAAVKRAQCRVGGVPASRAAGGARQGRAAPQRQRRRHTSLEPNGWRERSNYRECNPRRSR